MALLDALLLDPYPFQVWIAKRTDGVKGSGTASGPYDGSTATKLDALLNSIPANTHIHIGADTFETNGYADGETTGWQPKAAMKIEGSGIGVTTLKLVGTTQNKSYFAIGHALATGSPAVPNLLDYFEVSDLTIDCNLAGQSPAQVSCAAVRIMGNHCRIRRVKAKNWGTKYGATRCFVISAIIADPPSGVMEVVDAGIEDCMVVEPATTSIPANAPVTLIHAGGLENSTSEEAFGKSPFIRNCFLDAGSPTAGPEFRGLSMSWCRGGIIEGNEIHNMRYGGPYQNQTSTRDLIVRNNHYRNIFKGLYFYLRTYPGSLGTATLSKVGSLVTATTSADHKLSTGERVLITATNSDFTKWAEITVTAPNQFTYQSSASGSPGSATAIQKLFGIDRLLIEGNGIALATETSGELIGVQLEDLQPTGLQDPSYPAYQHGQVIVRNNKIRYVDGAYQTSPPFVGYGIQIFGPENAIIQDNVVESVPADPIRNERCGTATYFNNRTPSGVLIRGLDSITGKKYDELETEAEDALVLAMFNER